MKTLSFQFVFLLLIIGLLGCEKEAIKVLSTVLTTAATNITSTTATSGGIITNDGNSPVTSRGVCWSTNQYPTIASDKTSDGSGVGSFTSSITGLTPGGIYYVRAYATNAVGTAYGEQIISTTIAIIPTIATIELLGISSTAATGGGNITSDGGSAVIARGVCWSSSQNPTTANSKTENGMGTGIFSSSITGLTPGAVYYLRAYATNSIGTGYGNQLSFTTSTIIPVLTTTAITDIGATSATSGGNITSDGGSTVTSRGVCWSINQSPTISDNKSTNGTGTGSFISSLTGLTPGITYYIRAYAINSMGTGYGNQVAAITLAVTPTVTTLVVSPTTETTATGGGNITSDGGSPITSRGVCWSTNQTPTIANSKTLNGTGIGGFSSILTGLTTNTVYYVRSYATNAIGTSYGSESSVILYLNSHGPNVTDVDGNLYHSVKIGSQIWTVENLKTTKYRNGNLIGTTSPATLDISAQNTPKYQWTFGDNESNVATYGRLYTWYAATDSRNVCPAGWHVPTDSEWTTLTTYLGGESVAGGKLKEAGTSHWISPNTGATNSCGFSALPGGYRSNDGTFYANGYSGTWWSSTEGSTSTYLARVLGVGFDFSRANRGYTIESGGLSIRCVKD